MNLGGMMDYLTEVVLVWYFWLICLCFLSFIKLSILRCNVAFGFEEAHILWFLY